MVDPFRVGGLPRALSEEFPPWIPAGREGADLILAHRVGEIVEIKMLAVAIRVRADQPEAIEVGTSVCMIRRNGQKASLESARETQPLK
jgi:hypothetical protein